jgi:hypothetical protein
MLLSFCLLSCTEGACNNLPDAKDAVYRELGSIFIRDFAKVHTTFFATWNFVKVQPF